MVLPTNDISNGDSTYGLNNNRAASKPPSLLYSYTPPRTHPKINLPDLDLPLVPDIEEEDYIRTDAV